MRWVVALALLVGASGSGCSGHGSEGTPGAGAAAAVLAPTRLRTTTACSPGPCPTCTDCACGADEVAVSGGGQCAPGDAVIETSNPLLPGNADRQLSVRRLACNKAPPASAYALCIKRAGSQGAHGGARLPAEE